ncbi:MAG: hypothetical protein QM516_05060 [Limnohabitans sp.]|nr:hypothetical protein [Limnohabitans sp.]
MPIGFRLSALVFAVVLAFVFAVGSIAAPFANDWSSTVHAAVPIAHKSDEPRFSIAAIDAFIDETRASTLARARDLKIELPPDFLAWIDADRALRLSVYGSRADPLPVLLALRSLEIDLGEDTVRRDYPQLALAFAVQDSYAARDAKGTPRNDADGAKPPAELPDVSPRTSLSLVIPSDPRTPVNTKDPSRALDRNDHIINFLEDHAEIEADIRVKELPPLEYDENGVAKPQGKAVAVMKKELRKPVAADVIASRALQEEFNAYMAAHGHADVTIDCGDRVVHWYSEAAISDKDLRARIKAAHDLFHDAYRAKGRMPAERDRAPTPAESMAWFIRNDRHAFDDATRDARKWPRFPLNAPWPVLLMLAADDQPLREREEIWTKFRDEGEFRTYGEYIGGIAQQFDMQSARRVAPLAFNYGSIQMMWKDGGVCGTMGNIGARTHRIVGQPASTAGQPGHCAIVFMEHDAKTGEFRCKGGQYATGGDEVTTVHAGWNYDDIGGRKPMVFHQSIAWAVNRDRAAESTTFLETLAMRRMFDALPESERAATATAFAEAGLARNPCSLVVYDGAVRAANSTETALALADLASRTLDALPAASIPPLYRSTLRDLAHARIAALPAPKGADANRALLNELERQQCDDAKLLARTWRAIGGDDEFNARTRAATEAYLASPERAKGTGPAAKREADAFAKFVKAWSDTVKKPARKAWAESLLPLFSNRDTIAVRGKISHDPVVAELRKLADLK